MTYKYTDEQIEQQLTSDVMTPREVLLVDMLKQLLIEARYERYQRQGTLSLVKDFCGVPLVAENINFGTQRLEGVGSVIITREAAQHPQSIAATGRSTNSRGDVHIKVFTNSDDLREDPVAVTGELFRRGLRELASQYIKKEKV